MFTGEFTSSRIRDTGSHSRQLPELCRLTLSAARSPYFERLALHQTGSNWIKLNQTTPPGGKTKQNLESRNWKNVQSLTSCLDFGLTIRSLRIIRSYSNLSEPIRTYPNLKNILARVGVAPPPADRETVRLGGRENQLPNSPKNSNLVKSSQT